MYNYTIAFDGGTMLHCVEHINEVMIMDIHKLIAVFETNDESFYHGDVNADTIQALKELGDLREKIEEVKDLLNE
tara:strand:+ start:123 stop:347 length:225 start_codon:yes stop_codon:yes gene_type:complete